MGCLHATSDVLLVTPSHERDRWKWRILVPRDHAPFGHDQHQESRPFCGTDFLSMRREFLSHYQPIRFVRLDSEHEQSDWKSVNRGLPVLDQAGGRESWCWPKGVLRGLWGREWRRPRWGRLKEPHQYSWHWFDIGLHCLVLFQIPMCAFRLSLRVRYRRLFTAPCAPPGTRRLSLRMSAFTAVLKLRRNHHHVLFWNCLIEILW